VIVVDLFAGGGASRGIEAASAQRFASLVKWAEGDACWEWQGYRTKRRGGALSYGLFAIKKRSFLAHRMSWLLARGDIPPGQVIRHRCDNVACVRPDHLELGTQADNLSDMRMRGRAHFNRFKTGSEHPNAKIDPEKVKLIRRLRADGLSLAKIGAQVDLNASSVHDIVRGKTWGHVT
jgi:hypothetical protein